MRWRTSGIFTSPANRADRNDVIGCLSIEYATRIVDCKELRIRIERRDGSVKSPSRRSLPETNCAPPICPFFQIDFGKLL